MSKEYLVANTKIIDGKRKYSHFDLYKDDKIIKSFSNEESKKMRSTIKEKKIKRNLYKDKIIINDKDYINSLSPKRKFSKRKIIGLIVGTSLLTLFYAGGKRSGKGNECPVVINPITTESTFEEDTEFDNDIVEITTENNTRDIEIIKEDEIKDIGEAIIDNGFENIFKFTYEDRSSSENVDTVTNNYQNYIDEYSSMYGIDSKLMTAIICQENPNNEYNYNFEAGHGVPQIEHIWHGAEVYAYNYDTNEIESSGPIDVMRCNDDQEYSIKISCMIMNNYYNTIHDEYGDKLTPEEELAATVFAYNKGITAICTALDETNNYDDFIYYVKNNTSGGDNEYIEHVFSYIKDEDNIIVKRKDGTTNLVAIDNTSIENTKKTFS